jgi:hypothetical protein
MDQHVSRLALARQIIDNELGSGYAEKHPELLSAMLISASITEAGQLLAEAWTVEAEPQPLVRVAEGFSLLRK